MKPVEERFQVRSEIKESGPKRIASVDCYDCGGRGSLDSGECRRCVFEGLGGEEKVDRVVLKGSFKRIYSSSEISKLAKLLARLKTNALDLEAYYPEGRKEKCESCAEERLRKVEEMWPDIVRNFDDFSGLEEIILEEEEVSPSDCEICTEENFSGLLRGIKEALKDFSLYDKLNSADYDYALNAKIQPFFVEGVWNLSDGSSEVLDSYELPGGRGRVRILEQADRPVPFYDLDLPEFDIRDEEAELLYEAYRMEISSAPSHARFARPSRMSGFAEDWYKALLHIVEEESGYGVSNSRLRELAELMSNWLTYGVLEPLSYDEDITDIYIEAPPEIQPIRIVHQQWGNCETGVKWSSPSLLGITERLASKLGRSFDEPNPQLDAEIPELGLRLFVSRYPAIWSENSCAAAIRRRRERPWTQPLFMDEGSITPLASSLVSNLIRKGASVFTIGDIGTAKTSYLITQIPEIGSDERIIAFQDTEELQFQRFIEKGYELENVRVSDSDHLERQIDAFLRGGAAYWLITEVRSLEAVKSALGAAARRGSQPVLSTFHAKTKRQMYDLVCSIMGLDEAAYRYMDLIVRTSKFETSEGAIRRVTEVSEILKDWDDEPKYVTLFEDDRNKDILKPKKSFKGPEDLVKRINSYDLRDLDFESAVEDLSFLPPEGGGSRFITDTCERLAIDKDEFLARVLSEAKMKSQLLMSARESGNRRYLELPFVRNSYDKYFSLLRRLAPDYTAVLSEWEEWLEGKI